MVVHGDDFLTVGEEAGLDYMQQLLANEYDIKTARIGPEQGNAKELKALGRIIQYHDWGISYEPDPGHAQHVIHALGL